MDATWIKACGCCGTSSGPRTYISKPSRNGEGWKVSAGYSPGPVCDVCDTPWDREWIPADMEDRTNAPTK